MRQIELTQGKFAIVDDDDYVYLNKFTWYAVERIGHIYAERRVIVDGSKKNYAINMKNFIIEGKGGYIIAFKNKNTLDLRKENLIYVTTNTLTNRGSKAKNKSSEYKGVWFNKACPKKPWCANIEKTENGKVKRYRKQFLTEIEAATAYNKIASEWFGDYAYQNKLT